jgi:hypothetical protein
MTRGAQRPNAIALPQEVETHDMPKAGCAQVFDRQSPLRHESYGWQAHRTIKRDPTSTFASPRTCWTQTRLNLLRGPRVR